jgi:hypothetical protein
MTADDQRALYLDQVQLHGEMLAIRRSGLPDIPVRGWSIERESDELTGGLKQVRRTFVILEQDISAGSFPLPFKSGGADKVIWQGRSLNVEQAKHRRFAGETIAFEIETLG